MRQHNQNITILLKLYNLTSKYFAIGNYKAAWILELSIAKKKKNTGSFRLQLSTNKKGNNQG